MRVMGGGRPVTKAIIGARRPHDLNGANREKEEKQNTCRRTHHGHVAPQKSASPYHDEYHIRNCLGYPSKSSGNIRKYLKIPWCLGFLHWGPPESLVLIVASYHWWNQHGGTRCRMEDNLTKRAGPDGQYSLTLPTLPMLLDEARLLRALPSRAAVCDGATRQRKPQWLLLKGGCR